MSHPHYPQVPQHNLPSISRQLTQLGYQVESISQPWRHIIAHVQKKQSSYFLKISASTDINSKTKHEVAWYKHISTQKTQVHFQVPHVFHAGYLNQLYYYQASDFGDQVLATKYPPDPKKIEQYLNSIAQIIIDLDQLDATAWVNITKQAQPESLTHSTTNQGYIQTSHRKTKKLIKLLSTYISPLKSSMSHGDFVPWHMYDLKNRQIGLVDAEHAKIRPRYYDLAYFYIRVRANIHQPQLAKQLLRLVRSNLSMTDQQSFWQEFKPILAVKLINLYWEVFNVRIPADLNEAEVCDSIYQDLTSDAVL